MQNDYQILYEILKEKTGLLEASWKSVLAQLREATSQEKSVKNNFSNSETIYAKEAGRNSFGRRINPTLLKTESIQMETISGENPFLSAPIADQPVAKEFPLNRPVGKHAAETSAWKKLPSPSVAKVDIVRESTGSSKMEYSVYFKQGISGQKQDLLKKLAAAYYQIVFDEVIIDFASFTEGFGIILKILSVGHELFSLTSFSKNIVEIFLLQKFAGNNSANIFENPVELMLFSVLWIEGARERLVQLLPDSLKCFEKNLLLDALDPSSVQYFKINFRKEETLTKSFSENSTGLSLHSLLPVAYSNQRDSKNFFRDPTSHSNQQKIRDLFLNLIRHFSTNQLDTSHPNFNRNFGSRVSELMIKVSNENFTWLADLYIKEYEQAADVRLDRLEERMTSRRSTNGTSTTFSLDQIFFMFLQFADSFRLTRAIEKKTIAMISVSLEQANNPHKRALWSECIRKLRSIIKLLAFCRYKLTEILCDEDKSEALSVEEEDILIFSWTQDAILHKQLLTLLPLIYEYFIFIGADAIKSRCSNTVKLLIRYYQVKFESKRKRAQKANSGIRPKLFLRLALEDIFRETLQPEFYSECVISMSALNEDNDSDAGGVEEDEKRISKTQNKDNGVFARSIDEDDTLPLAVSGVYRSISSQVRAIYVQLNSICMNFAWSNTLNNAEAHKRNSDTNSNIVATDSTPRKVRPITQVPAADLKQQKIQKQLRQWFWWRYGSQKDLIDALNSYILEQLLFPQFPMTSSRTQSAEACKKMYKELICKILPELLPNFWKESPELVEMIISLSTEVAGKSIMHHFS